MSERIAPIARTAQPTPSAESSGGFIPLLQLVERLALDGYPFDLSKWESLVNAGLLSGLPPTPSYDCQVPHAIEDRIRAILDIERRLPVGTPVDKLAFYLAVAGMTAIPTMLVGSYIETSFTKFFIVGDGMLRRLERRPPAVGAFGERRLADAMAKTVLRDYSVLAARSYVACRQLLATAFVMYFRMTWENKKPQPRRANHRIVTPEFLDWTRLPVKTMGEPPTPPDAAPATSLQPAVDRDRIFTQLRAACATNPVEVIQAAQDAALVISTATTQYPELESKPPDAPKSAFAHWVLSLVPPILAAGLYRVSQRSGAERYANLIPDRKETGLEGILRTVLVYWHT